MAETVPHDSWDNKKGHEQQSLNKQRSKSSTRLNKLEKAFRSNPRTVGHTETYPLMGKRLESSPLKRQ